MYNFRTITGELYGLGDEYFGPSPADAYNGDVIRSSGEGLKSFLDFSCRFDGNSSSFDDSLYAYKNYIDRESFIENE